MPGHGVGDVFLKIIIVMPFVSGLFVVVVARKGVLALVPWGVRGLYDAKAIEHKACPPTMGGESPRAIKHPAVIGIGGLRAPEPLLACCRSRRGARLSARP